MKSFVPKDGTGKPPELGGKNLTMDFKGEKRSNKTLTSTTDDQAQLFKKSAGDKSHLCYMGHTPIDNRNGLVVDGETTQTTRNGEREAALKIAAPTIKGGSTLDTDKRYDTVNLVQSLRKLKVTQHVTAKQSGSAIDGCTTRHARYAASLKKRKLVEEILG